MRLLQCISQEACARTKACTRFTVELQRWLRARTQCYACSWQGAELQDIIDIDARLQTLCLQLDGRATCTCN